MGSNEEGELKRLGMCRCCALLKRQCRETAAIGGTRDTIFFLVFFSFFFVLKFIISFCLQNGSSDELIYTWKIIIIIYR